jgi:hypothetical protein
VIAILRENKTLVMRTSIIFPIALLLILGYLINNTQAYKQSGPMLKVIVRTSGTIISGGTTEYYLVYDSGAVRKCPEFTPTLVEAYQVDENNIYDSAFLINTNSWNR